jgi:cell fate regulator YaaT (PSP1 superfamily)
MACASCAVGTDGKPGGCSGSCSGGCNRMNTYDWLSELDIQDTANDFDVVEVSFNKGAHKDFYHNPMYLHASTGDTVLVEVPGGGGYDVGHISLTGDLVRLQLKKKSVKDGSLFLNIIRRANDRDIEKLNELRSFERETMVRARAISRTLDLDMKLGDVEYQGDGRKCTFFYTADGRVDFRELIRHFAKEFKVKIEMRQIGARQESSRIGGIGTCGRELCCSTWLSDFKSVSTVAARYQQLAINQAKLSGMCGRLKCCLNYELDTYLDALEDFPQNPERLKTKNGSAVLIKTDVFKGLLIYVFENGPEKGKFYTLRLAEVKEVIEMNKRGEQPEDFKDLQFVPSAAKGGEDDEEDEDDTNNDYGGDLVGAVELPDDKRKKKKKKKRPGGNDRPFNDRPEGQGQRRPESNAPQGERREGQNQQNPQRQQQPQRPPQPRPDRPERTDRPARPERAERPPQPPPVKDSTDGTPQPPKTEGGGDPNKKKRWFNKNKGGDKKG